MQKCIVVLGMHRSGTSALMGALKLLGVSLGTKLMNPNEYNPKGYFENDSVYQFNEKLLQALNSSWDDLFFLEKDWWKKQSLGVYRNKVFEIIEQEFNGTETFYIKDPRLCILLPFWNDLFEKIGVKTSCIISLRNPLEVACSLEKRDGLSIQKGILLWMTHMLSAEFHSRCLPRVFISYYDLLNKPGDTIAHISDVLNIDFPESYEKRKKDIEQFLESNLKHFNIDDTNLKQDIISLTYRYYMILLKLVRKNSTNDEELLKIDKIRKEFYEIQNLFYNQEIKALAGLEGVVRQKDSLLQDQVQQIHAKDAAIQEQERQIHAKDSALEEQARQIHAKDTHICNIESELNLMRQSRVWRIAEFFRRLFYHKFLGKSPLLQKGMLTISREGFDQFFAKTRCYLRKNKDVATMGLIESDYDKWIKKNQLTDEMIGEIKKEIAGFQYRPKISIIMPVYNVDQIWLEKAINSVINQLYENWELCIADDASTKKHIKKTLERYSKKEKRIKIKYLEVNQGISGASNEALSLATGEYIGLLDNDDELTIEALYENVKLLNKHPEADMIYSDEDKLDMNGNRCEPHFKPDWSPDMFLSEMYTCHFGVYSKSIVDKIGGFRKGYEGSQDYDLVLRLTEKTTNIFHIPAILYHWRKIPGSAANSTDAKDYAYVNAKKALSDYLRRNSIEGEVVDGEFIGSYRVRRAIKNDPKISIIIPFKDRVEVLKKCVKSIIEKTNYEKLEIILVNNQSKQEETFKYLDKIKDNPIFRILAYDKPFNFSAINNYAVSEVDSEYIVLLNNDTEVISPDWIETMLEFAQRKDVGAVGALLYYPNDTVQHGGIIVGIAGVAAHSHRKARKDSLGYFGRIKIVHNLSAVTAACLMTKKSIFKEVDGFDVNLTHAFNDVDYCLKIREKGYLIVYTPYAELYHHESLSRGYEDTPEKQARFRKEIELFRRKWKDILTNGDPYYNPNLTLDREDFSIKV